MGPRLQKIPVEERLRPGAVTLALCALFWIAGLTGCRGEVLDRPNLVLISVDRLAADRLVCFGGARDAGGSICALGEEGTLFAWAASPGRGEASGAATVLTGLPEAVHGVGSAGQSFLANAHTSIAEDLSAVGYATAAFVTSPRVNRSRRLDQGFGLYDDRLASPSRIGPSGIGDSEGRTGSVGLSDRVQSWIDTAQPPWFVWIHANRDAGLVELDRLLSRLSQTLDGEDEGPGIVFLALRGESEEPGREIESTADANRTISWRSHRVPLIWHPAKQQPRHDLGASVSRRLASLMDVAPTLRAAALLPPTSASKNRDGGPRNARTLPGDGHDLGADEWTSQAETLWEERFLLLETTASGSDVGLASQHHIYTRRASPLDGTGRPVQTSSLIPLAARFASLPPAAPMAASALLSARFEPGPWRNDVLGADSPVPRLEFHLARQLGTRRETEKGKDL